VPVQVDAMPNASFTSDVVSGCSILTVHFTNTSVAGQPAVIDRLFGKWMGTTDWGFRR